MVSGHPKSIGIPCIDGLSTGPPGFGASQPKSMYKGAFLHKLENEALEFLSSIA